MMVIKNKDGSRNSHTDHAEVMFSLDGKPQENAGRVIGAALCYSGNYELRIDTRDTDYHQFFAGINPDNSSYKLEPKEVFKTPELALTYSDEGLSGASRNFHRWGRSYKLAHGDKPRKILLNSWEGVYFNINEPGMDQMMADIASMGGELFVMDDGWFGVKYPRLTDNCALGDWEVDRNKLPNGIGWLVEQAHKHGIKFGIWIEPEMTNTASELYEKHPDWVLKAPERDVVTGRGGTQLVLDLANPQVQDFIFKVVDDLMTENPEIDYIKWDANMPVANHGSQYLPKDKQSHLHIEYHRGFAAVCDRIRAKYPDLTIQACASGGGRANWGVLPWFDEFWVSDNTDALQRVYMQWGTSYFFPAIAMASHISATPNHTVFRTTSLKYPSMLL
jgi:alpha-galactosidase